ncbi:MAG: DUF1934 family protein [Streptococcaceae bacterium]|nr:DUF1934 family protein [Streptococcaceae bacterium]
MKIIFDNHITVDQKSEHLTEIFEGELTKRADKFWLIFENTDHEKVLLKFNEKELMMVRYGDFPTTMRYRENELTHNAYQGLGEIEIFTHYYEFTADKVILHYTMSQADLELGTYKLEITYSEG